MIAGHDYFALRILSLVAISRVFHHCHFFGDTIMGAFIGFIVAFTFSYYEIAINLFGVWFNTTNLIVKLIINIMS